MNIQQIMDALINILNELGVPADQLKPDSLLFRDLQLDSAEIVEVSVALKQRFDIKVKLEARQDRTLAEVCDLIDLSILEESRNVS